MNHIKRLIALKKAPLPEPVPDLLRAEPGDLAKYVYLVFGDPASAIISIENGDAYEGHPFFTTAAIYNEHDDFTFRRAVAALIEARTTMEPNTDHLFGHPTGPDIIVSWSVI